MAADTDAGQLAGGHPFSDKPIDRRQAHAHQHSQFDDLDRGYD